MMILPLRATSYLCIFPVGRQQGGQQRRLVRSFGARVLAVITRIVAAFGRDAEGEGRPLSPLSVEFCSVPVEGLVAKIGVALAVIVSNSTGLPSSEVVSVSLRKYTSSPKLARANASTVAHTDSYEYG